METKLCRAEERIKFQYEGWGQTTKERKIVRRLYALAGEGGGSDWNPRVEYFTKDMKLDLLSRVDDAVSVSIRIFGRLDPFPLSFVLLL